MSRTRHRLIIVLLAILPVLRTTHAQQATPYRADAGPWRVEVIDETWRDDSRTTDGKAREVPVRIYLPRPHAQAAKAGKEEETPKLPVVVFSHGLGGSREGYGYFGQHLASHGYLTIHPQHAGSDGPTMRELMRRSGDDDKNGAGRRERRLLGRRGQLLDDGTSDPDNLVNRPLDIRFVIDRVGTHAKLAPLADMSHIGVAGHSYGSYTAMAIAGMLVHVPEDHGGPVRSFHDERVKAIIAMSPQGPGVMGVEEDGWSKIDLPALLMTGSKDMGQADRAVEWRLTPFEKLKNTATRLLYIDGATHMTFSGASGVRAALRGGPRNVAERHLGFVKQTCTAYLDAHLRNDAAARKWLDERAIEKVSKDECELRSRPVSK